MQSRGFATRQIEMSLYLVVRNAHSCALLGDLFVYFCTRVPSDCVRARYVSINKLRLLTEHATLEIIYSYKSAMLLSLIMLILG